MEYTLCYQLAACTYQATEEAAEVDANR